MLILKWGYKSKPFGELFKKHPVSCPNIDFLESNLGDNTKGRNDGNDSLYSSPPGDSECSQLGKNPMEKRVETTVKLNICWTRNQETWVLNKVLLYSTWNSAQSYVAVWVEGSLGENGYMCIYGWAPSLFSWKDHNAIC